MIETVMVASDLKVGLLRDVDICRYRVKTDLAVVLGVLMVCLIEVIFRRK